MKKAQRNKLVTGHLYWVTRSFILRSWAQPKVLGSAVVERYGGVRTSYESQFIECRGKSLSP